MQRKEPKIENGITFWKCPVCKNWLSEDDYYQNKRKLNKLTSLCKKCTIQGNLRTRNLENTRRLSREWMRRARKSNPEKFRIISKLNYKKNGAKQRIKHELKAKCRSELRYAILAGKVIKPSNCSNCGEVRKVTAHHDDYNRPLVVRWLCNDCHGKQTVIDNFNQRRNSND